MDSDDVIIIGDIAGVYESESESKNSEEEDWDFDNESEGGQDGSSDIEEGEAFGGEGGGASLGGGAVAETAVRAGDGGGGELEIGGGGGELEITLKDGKKMAAKDLIGKSLTKDWRGVVFTGVVESVKLDTNSKGKYPVQYTVYWPEDKTRSKLSSFQLLRTLKML